MRSPRVRPWRRTLPLSTRAEPPGLQSPVWGECPPTRPTPPHDPIRSPSFVRGGPTMSAAATTVTATGKPPGTMSQRERWRRRGPLLPALIFTIFVTQIPFLLTIAISTLNWNILQPGDKNFLGFGQYESFAGLDNYVTVFTDTRLRNAVVNTIVLTTSVVVISLLIGLALAVLLDRKFLGRGLARTLLIAPFLVMPVASALVWKHALYNPDYGLLNGVLNWVFGLFGAEEGPTVDWVSSFPMPAVIAALVWQWTPFMMLILLAGLQSQPVAVPEAAKLALPAGPRPSASSRCRTCGSTS